ncbi:MAG: ribbon-helix-helix domain-containing protein [Hyphomicrobiaceae bacterium]|nr:ribbon-helix-helix domain-containing protein [Hyphomicrobiaceae bacterium]MCC0024857.1 ribbon-helix-helix domain-containing protein [Hyphomicrobiaceae bacterium]
MIKRTITLSGHQTSVALEQPFWDGVDEIARQRAISWSQLVAEIDAARQAANLASALRLTVLAHYRDLADRRALS